MSNINRLPVKNYTLRDLRVAAQTAEACGYFDLATQLRGLHNIRLMIEPQPAPVNTEESKEVTVDVDEAMYPRAARLLRERKAFGLRKYGTPLKTFNGRDPRVDELQELLDAQCYRAQGAMEGRGVGIVGAYLPKIEELARDIESTFRNQDQEI